MEKELSAFESTNTWELVVLPEEKVPIGGKQVLRSKLKQIRGLKGLRRDWLPITKILGTLANVKLQFNVKDLGTLRYYLSIEVLRNDRDLL